MSHQVNEGDVEEHRLQQQQAQEPGAHESLDTGQMPGTAAMSAQFADRPSDAAIAEIEEERRRRLQHRPPNAEVDNTHRVFNPELGRFEDCEDPIHFQHPRRR